MQLARVMGTVVASAKVPQHAGHKLLLVRPEKADGTLEARSYIAVDLVQAGEGDRVLLIREGSSVRDMLGKESTPIHAAVVGIVDEVAYGD
jgi:ethanolamine utilization protein EutN